MSKNLISTLSIIGGLVLIVVSISADLLGVSGDPNAFGWKQITGTAVGLLLFLAGIWLRRNKQQ